MIAPRNSRVMIKAEELRLTLQHNVALFGEFHGDRRPHILTDLDAATGQIPTGNIGVAYEKNARLVIEHHHAHPEGHAARQEEPQVKRPHGNALEQAQAAFDNRIGA